MAALLIPRQAFTYGVLTHQAVIDVSWKPALVPVLKKRFPNVTDQELRTAHAFAYGGAILQDMGYYPFGNTFFTDLTHYVRSGDFVENLLAEAHSLNEYAFALGALAHYYADNYGHPIGTNRAVPMVYPEMREEYGNTVTYAEDPVSHVKMEFAFDVVQVARGNYAPEEYHEFVGFKVSEELLEKAFKKTYGIELGSLFLSTDLTIGSFRRAVSDLIPNLTRAAWNNLTCEVLETQPSMTRRKFIYKISNADYHEEWGREYERPNLFQRILSWLLRVLPKIGPLKAFAFQAPTPEAEKVFMESFNVTVEQYAAGIKAVSEDKFSLANTVLDTGHKTMGSEYEKAVETYAELLERLHEEEFKPLTPALKQNILQFYQSARGPAEREKEDLKEWEKTMKLLDQLKAHKVQ